MTGTLAYGLAVHKASVTNAGTNGWQVRRPYSVYR